MTPDIIARNREIGVGQDETVLAYCASGTRSTIAWALGQAGTQPADDLIAAARAGGYDISHMRGILSASYA
ncbi:pyridine nucleotide-disulphide oxidoreductase [Roseobacter sp. GAI101]|nr:pyridine nucleotide-disulphide oxidoreductase [Roseobacter sp. GAI101]